MASSGGVVTSAAVRCSIEQALDPRHTQGVKNLLLCAILLMAIVPGSANAHASSQDHIGCYHDRRTWEYHCPDQSKLHKSSPHLEATSKSIMRRRRREEVQELLGELRSQRRSERVPKQREPYSAERLRMPRTARSFRSSQEEAQVMRVTDGDTIEVRLSDGTFDIVRIVGIDAPELTPGGEPPECYANKASARLKRLLARRAVRLKIAGTRDRDRDSRLLRFVSLNTRDVGTLMLMEGLAHAFEQYPHAFLEQYKGIEQWARRERVGLWGHCR